MDLLKLIIENFLCYHRAEIDCTQFNSALIVAEQDHNDRYSNGCGKSTIFRALEYVLFGYYDSKTIDEIIRWGQTVAQVTVEIIEDGQKYKIIRSRNSKTRKSDLQLFQFKNDQWVSIEQKTNSETEVELAKIIKINHSTFRNSVIFVQDDINHLSSVETAKERKAILKEVLNLAIYSKLEKLTKEEASLENKELILIRDKINLLGNPQKIILDMEKILTSNTKTLTQFQAKRPELEAEISSLNDKLAIVEKSLGPTTLELTAKVQDKKQQIQSLTKEIDLLSKSVIEKEYTLKSHQQDLDQKLALLPQKEKELLALPRPDEDPITLESKLSTLKTKSNGVYVSIAVNKNKISSYVVVPEDVICKLCKQPVGPEHKHKINAEIQNEIASLLQENKNQEQEYSSLEQQIQQFKKQIEAYTLAQTSIRAATEKLDVLKISIDQKKEHVKNLTHVWTELKGQLDQKNSTLSVLIEEFKSLNQQLSQYNLEQLTLEKNNLISELKQVQEQLKLLDGKISQLNIDSGVAQDKLKSQKKILKSLEDLKLQEQNLENSLKIWGMVAQSYGPSGIPAMIIYTILDDLQQESNTFLEQLKPELKLAFSVIKDKSDGSQEDTFDILYYLNGHEVGYKNISGGQKFVIALALRFGMAAILQKRLGIEVKFLELDEVDEKLDEAGVEALIKLIRVLQNKYKIFVITHREKMKDNFSNLIRVNYHPEQGATAILEAI